MNGDSCLNLINHKFIMNFKSIYFKYHRFNLLSNCFKNSKLRYKNDLKYIIFSCKYCGLLTLNSREGQLKTVSVINDKHHFLNPYVGVK